MADEAPEALRRLEERLSRASAAAERLVAEAARSAVRPGSAPDDRPPPAGWQVPPAEEAPPRRQSGELEMLVGAIHLLRDLVPPEVVQRLAAALRELLLAVRALIDFYLEWLERPKPDRSEVRDIPID